MGLEGGEDGEEREGKGEGREQREEEAEGDDEEGEDDEKNDDHISIFIIHVVISILTLIPLDQNITSPHPAHQVL